jgi:isopentenyl-diphosphate delta-isomerase
MPAARIRDGGRFKTATQRRLWQECGIKTALREVDSFIYRANFNAKIAEHEYDHVFVGKHDGKFKFDKNEADGWALDRLRCACEGRESQSRPLHALV